MNSDYKKYSLDRLEEWMHDVISSTEATPQEIYDVIKNVVDENYHMHKLHTSRCYELLALLNGNGKGHLSCDKDDPSPECKSAWNDFWEEPSMPPWGHSDIEYGLHYTDEEIEAMCDAAEKVDKVKKWVLPVELDPSGECFVTFPDDLLEAVNLKEGDTVEWITKDHGSYIMRKVEKKENPSWVKGNELAKVKTYQEMIDDGWSMTDDGFWIKEK